jgi:nucleoside-diphosphate-sugar epimerase
MEFWGPDSLFERANHVPTVALHAAAVAAGVPRFVLVSAASVSTGSQRRPVVDESTPEGRPNIAYSRVKLATERALLAAHDGNTELVVVRPPFIWGRGMTTLDEMAEVARAGRFAWIDHGRHIVDFVHVENLVGAVLRALTQGRHRGVYYVTDGTPMPLRDFLTPLLATRGVDVSRSRSVPLAVAAPMAAMMDRTARLLRRKSAPPLTNWLVSFTGRDRSYDITAARTELGYSPEVTVERGLAEMGSA